jgi:hypothetical protein
MVRCPPRWFPSLLAFAFAVQAVLALGLCLRAHASPAPFQIEICSGDGLVTITLHGEEEGGGAPAEAPGAAVFCFACQGLPLLLAAAPPVLALPSEAPRATPMGLSEARAPPGLRAAAYAPRGPPEAA